MAHHRTTIRDALISLLTGLPSVANLYPERGYRVGPDDLPAVVFSLADDDTDTGDAAMGAPEVEEAQTIMVEVHATGGSGKLVAEALDQMELEVEGAIGADPTLGNLVEIVLKSGSTLEMNVDQDRVLGVRVITYVAQWRHAFGAPDIAES